MSKDVNACLLGASLIRKPDAVIYHCCTEFYDVNSTTFKIIELFFVSFIAVSIFEKINVLNFEIPNLKDFDKLIFFWERMHSTRKMNIAEPLHFRSIIKLSKFEIVLRKNYTRSVLLCSFSKARQPNNFLFLPSMI